MYLPQRAPDPAELEPLQVLAYHEVAKTQAQRLIEEVFAQLPASLTSDVNKVFKGWPDAQNRPDTPSSLD